MSNLRKSKFSGEYRYPERAGKEPQQNRTFWGGLACLYPIRNSKLWIVAQIYPSTRQGGQSFILTYQSVIGCNFSRERDIITFQSFLSQPAPIRSGQFCGERCSSELLAANTCSSWGWVHLTEELWMWLLQDGSIHCIGNYKINF